MDQTEKEIHDLINFLHEIDTKKKGEHVSLDYRGSIINLGVVLIGRRSVLFRYGPYPYIICIERLVKSGIDTIYVLARGKCGEYVARYVSEVIKRNGIIKTVEDMSADKNGFSNVCIRLGVNPEN